MKILYLVHPQFDLGEFNLYMGLCDIIGVENVIVFPKKSLYYGVVDNYSGGYPAFLRDLYRNKSGNNSVLPYGIPPFGDGEDVIGGYPNTRELPYLVTVGAHNDFSEDQIIDAIRAGSFNFIVLTSSNRVCTMALARIRDRMGGLDKLPGIVYVDNGERDEFNAHWWHVFRAGIKVVFKLILTPDVYQEYKQKYGLELHCLPQSSCLAGKEIKVLLDKYHRMLYRKGVTDFTTFNTYDKVIDVYGAMGITYEKRNDLIRALKNYGENKPNRVVITSPAIYYRYLNLIAHSKIGVSMRGSGRDSSRFWDIPMMQAAMLCDGEYSNELGRWLPMGCLHPFPFEDGKNCIYYNENRLDEIPNKLEYYLENDSEWLRVSKEGYRHLLAHHTNEQRARQFLEIVNQELIQI
jgi:hypothetical protein